MGTRGRFQRFADQLKEIMARRGGSMRLREVLVAIGRIPNLIDRLRQAQLSGIGFLNIFSKTFKRENEVVPLVGFIPAPAAAAPAPPALEERRGRGRQHGSVNQRTIRQLNDGNEVDDLPAVPATPVNEEALEVERFALAAALRPPARVRRGPGRPPRSLNKRTIERMNIGSGGAIPAAVPAAIPAAALAANPAAAPAAIDPPVKRGRGRPPGSLNKKTLQRMGLAPTGSS